MTTSDYCYYYFVAINILCILYHVPLIFGKRRLYNEAVVLLVVTTLFCGVFAVLYIARFKFTGAVISASMLFTTLLSIYKDRNKYIVCNMDRDVLINDMKNNVIETRFQWDANKEFLINAKGDSKFKIFAGGYGSENLVFIEFNKAFNKGLKNSILNSVKQSNRDTRTIYKNKSTWVMIIVNCILILSAMAIYL